MKREDRMGAGGVNGICNIFQSIVINIMNTIALISPAHIRWEGVCQSHSGAQLHISHCDREENIRSHICEHFGDVYIVCVGQRAVGCLKVLLLKVLVAVVHSLLDLHVVRFTDGGATPALFQFLS